MAVTIGQSGFRIRFDNGSETTATFYGAQNANPIAVPLDTNVRVRFLMQNSGSTASNNLVAQLEYTINGGASTNVNASSTVVRSSASPNLADAANITQQLTGGTGTFIGLTGFDEVDGAAGGASLDVPASGNFEVEYSVQFRSADIVAGVDVITLRVTNNGTDFSGVYAQVPSLIGKGRIVSDTPTATDVIANIFLTPAFLSVADTPTATDVKLIGMDRVGHWKFDDGSGNTAVDSSGNANSGTLTPSGGPDWVAGVRGTNALHFTASNSEYVALGTPDDLDLSNSNAVSVSAWINPDTLPATANIVCRGGDVASIQYFMRFAGVVNLQFQTFFSGGSHGVAFDTTGLVSAGTWYHVVGTFDGTTWKIYINATLRNTAVDAVSLPAGVSGPTTIGTNNSIADFFDGIIDDVRIYNYALSQAEVSTLFAIPISVSDSPIATDAITVTPLGGVGNPSPSVSDSPTATESTSVVFTLSLSQSDTPTTTDIITLIDIGPIFISISDAPTTTDAASVTFASSISVSDAPTATDVITTIRVNPLLTAVSDAPTVTEDVQIVLKHLFTSLSDTPTTTEATSVVFALSLSQNDTPTATDVITIIRVNPIPISVFEDATTTESVSLTAAASLSKFDSSVVTESISTVFTLSVNQNDAPTATDVITVIRVNPLLLVVSDAPTATEAISLSLVSNIATSDAPTTTDVITLIKINPLRLEVFDDATAIEDVSIVLKKLYILVFDDATATDAVDAALKQNLPASVSDTPTVTDAISIFLAQLPIAVFDDATISESISTIVTPLRVSESDTPSATDAVTITSVANILVADSPIVTESISTVLTVLYVSTSDAPTATDEIVILLNRLVLVVDDSPLVTDAISILLPIINISINDGPTATEFETHFLTPLQFSLFDAPTATESVVLIVLAAGSAAFILTDSAFIAVSGEPTTPQILPPEGKGIDAFQAGQMQDDENPADSIDLDADKYTEIEWAIQATEFAQTTQYEFRVTVSGVPLATYSATPLWDVLDSAVFAFNDDPIVTDAMQLDLHLVLSRNDTPTATEVISLAIASSLVKSEAPIVTEATQLRFTLSDSIFDDATATDDASLLLRQLKIITNDSAVVSDAKTVVSVANIAKAESPFATESIQVRIPMTISEAESLFEDATVTDDLTLSNTGRYVETATVTEDAALLLPFLIISKSDTAIVIDDLQLSFDLAIDLVSDDPIITDAADLKTRQLKIIENETPTVTESAQLLLPLLTLVHSDSPIATDVIETVFRNPLQISLSESTVTEAFNITVGEAVAVFSEVFDDATVSDEATVFLPFIAMVASESPFATDLIALTVLHLPTAICATIILGPALSAQIEIIPAIGGGVDCCGAIEISHALSGEIEIEECNDLNNQVAA